MVHVFEIPVASGSRLRPVLCITAILFHAVCSAPAALAYCAYVTNERSGTLSVIDTTLDAVIATVDVGSWASGVVVAPDSRTVYVARQRSAPGGNTVVVLDTRTNIVTATIPACSVDSPPISVTITPNGKFLCVTCPGLNNVWVIDTKTTATTDIVSVGKLPIFLSITPDGRFVYVANTQDPEVLTPGDVSVIDTASRTVVATIPVGNNPIGVAVTPDGRFVYVANSQGPQSQVPAPGDVSVIDTASRTVVATIPVGNTPGGVAITPDGRFAYVANVQGFQTPTPGDVSVIDTAKALTDPGHAVIATIPVGNNPIGAGITPDGRFAYAVNSQGLSSEAPVTAGNVSVIDTSSNTVVRTIPVGLNPAGGAISSLPMCVDGHPTCVGDCGVDTQVTVKEIITLVNIALGNAPVSDCRAGDADGDGQVTVDEILQAVNNALNGC